MQQRSEDNLRSKIEAFKTVSNRDVHSLQDGLFLHSLSLFSPDFCLFVVGWVSSSSFYFRGLALLQVVNRGLTSVLAVHTHEKMKKRKKESKRNHADRSQKKSSSVLSSTDNTTDSPRDCGGVDMGDSAHEVAGFVCAERVCVVNEPTNVSWVICSLDVFQCCAF